MFLIKVLQIVHRERTTIKNKKENNHYVEKDTHSIE